QHGSSATSSGTAAVTCWPADSSRTVRRGVPYALATSASSWETSFLNFCSSSSRAGSWWRVACRCGWRGSVAGRGGARRPRRAQPAGPPRRAARLAGVRQPARADLPDLLLVLQRGRQLVDGRLQLLLAGLDLQPGVLREPPQLHVEDVVGLDLRQLEDRHQSL